MSPPMLNGAKRNATMASRFANWRKPHLVTELSGSYSRKANKAREAEMLPQNRKKLNSRIDNLRNS